jgi:hypothetical protein
MSVQEIENAITKLPAAELDALRDWLGHYRAQQQSTAQDEAQKRAAFHAALHEAELLTRPLGPQPGTSSPRHLVEASGKPVSETLLEERR